MSLTLDFAEIRVYPNEGRGNLGIREYRYEVACHGREKTKRLFAEIFFSIFWQCLLSPIPDI
jgi:hypothetical protein